MHYDLSPYALLQASKPRKNNTMTTVYDLYSAAHSSQAQVHETQSAGRIEEHSFKGADRSANAAPVRTISAGKTHYIADIQKRHNAAVRRSALS